MSQIKLPGLPFQTNKKLLMKKQQQCCLHHKPCRPNNMAKFIPTQFEDCIAFEKTGQLHSFEKGIKHLKKN